MTTKEFSDEFDMLFNNISSNQAPGLTEYEKSVFLTTAQDDLILELVTGKTALGESFEKTEELREYLTDIVKTATLEEYIGTEVKTITKDQSKLYTPPEDLFTIVYELVSFNDTKLNCIPSKVEVIPITHDELSKTIKNPFKKPNKNRVLRLNVGGAIELLTPYTISEYTIRYISKLDPIILEDIDTYGLSIKGENKKTECKLNPALHKAILSRAVSTAKTAIGVS